VSTIVNHPQRNTIRLQLKQNLMLREIPVAAWEDLEPQLEIAEYRKGEPLVRQGSTNMEQFFILDGILKRVVSNPQGKEMILRFAAETDMDTSYAAWRMKTPIPTASPQSPRSAWRGSRCPTGSNSWNAMPK